MRQTTKVLSASAGDLMAQLLEEAQRRQDIQPDDVTVPRFAEAAKISHHTARRFLQRKVDAGELVTVVCRSECGVAVTVYRRKED
jgi:hypothetical protein